MLRTTTAALAAALLLSACAQRSAQIAPSYVPASRFAGMDCAQLRAEAQTVAAHLNTTSAAQNQKASTDAAMVATGVLIFWPMLLMTSGGLGADDASGELAALKGEAEGLSTAYAAQSCALPAVGM